MTTPTKRPRGKERTKTARSLALILCSLGLGLLSACSEVRTQIVTNKQSTSENAARTYGTVDGSGRPSLWNLDYKQVN